MDKVIDSVMRVKRIGQTSGNLFVPTKSTPCFYMLKEKKEVVNKFLSFGSKNKRARYSWLDFLTCVFGLSILGYLLLCAILNVYALDSFIGI